MAIFSSNLEQLQQHSHFWIGPGVIWQQDFDRVLKALGSCKPTLFEQVVGDRLCASGWVVDDPFETELLGAPARRAHVLLHEDWDTRCRAEVGEWLGRRLAGVRFASVQTWQEKGIELESALEGFRLVAVDRYFVGTLDSMNLPAVPPEPPTGFELQQKSVGELDTSEAAAVRHIHGFVQWHSRFHADPGCDPAHSRLRARAELDRLLAQPEVPLILGRREGQIVAYWITPVEPDLDLGARHAQGANLVEGSGIATCMVIHQHKFIFSKVSTVLHPTQESNQRVARLLSGIGCDVLCHRLNFHKWNL